MFELQVILTLAVLASGFGLCHEALVFFYQTGSKYFSPVKELLIAKNLVNDLEEVEIDEIMEAYEELKLYGDTLHQDWLYRFKPGHRE